MSHALDERYPSVAYLLAAYLIGDDDFDTEVDQVVASEGPERGRDVLGELRQLLADPTVTGDELTAFVSRHTLWLHDTGRATLALAAARLAHTLGDRDR